MFGGGGSRCGCVRVFHFWRCRGRARRISRSGFGAVGRSRGDHGEPPHQAERFLPVRPVEQRQLPGVSIRAGVEEGARLYKGRQSDLVFFGQYLRSRPRVPSEQTSHYYNHSGCYDNPTHHNNPTSRYHNNNYAGEFLRRQPPPVRWDVSGLPQSGRVPQRDYVCKEDDFRSG